ncbi:hypothetical protein MMC13_004084 [Lambiella insularis]|nr:hypothetical protein [Lambiella insularis]
MAEAWHGFDCSLADTDERRVLFATLDSFRWYRRAAHYNVTHRRRQNFYALPTLQWQLLAGPPFNVLSILDRVDDAIDANAEIAQAILQTSLGAFGLEPEPVDLTVDWRGTAKPSDMDKVRSTIRQLYRDWSLEGAVERSKSYLPVLEDLASIFPVQDRGTVKVLIPGSGLGRLVFEVCRLGFDAEGNELSYHQLMTSNWILNQLSEGQQFDLYPFALTFSNHMRRENQIKCVKIPDIHPTTALDLASSGVKIHAVERMNMTAADFVILYGNKKNTQRFDAVVTVFFLDTAPNVLRYIEVICNCLKDGSYWINLGPLLWHFEESRGPQTEHAHEKEHRKEETDAKLGIEEPGSVELTNEEVLLLVEKMGFTIQMSRVEEGCGYTQDPNSMLQNMYIASHWIAQKK